jgi:hypothetical protein
MTALWYAWAVLGLLRVFRNVSSAVAILRVGSCSLRGLAAPVVSKFWWSFVFPLIEGKTAFQLHPSGVIVFTQ